MNEVSEQGPTILVIDELDGLIGKRNDSHQSEVSRQVKNLILTLTAGVASLPGIFVIGATNHPELIDTAYLDRCTKIIKMNLPTQNDKYTFFQSYMTEQGYDHTITEPEFLSLNTNLYSYRNLEGLLGAALEDGPFKRAEDSKHFKVIEGDDNDFFEGCSCENEDCEQLQKNYFDIPHLTLGQNEVREEMRRVEIFGKQTHLKPSQAAQLTIGSGLGNLTTSPHT